MAVKPMSQNMAESLKANRVKAATLTDGQRVLTFAICPEDATKQALYTGDVVRCDECPNVSTINGGFLTADNPAHTVLAMPFVHSSRMLEPDSIGCYDTDGSGDVLCPDCAAKRDARKAGGQ